MTAYISLPIQAIINSYQSGESLSTLAAKHQVSKGTIRNILAAAKVTMRSPGCGKSSAVWRAPSTSTHTYKAFEINDVEAVEGPLHPQELVRLRRAVGWTSDWTGPYDPIRGD